MKKLHYLAFVIFANFLLTSCSTTSRRITELETRAPWKKEIPSAYQTSKNLDSYAADTGYFLYDPAIRKVLDSKDEDQFFIPASTTKIITTYAALQILGPEYRFKTYLKYRGKIQNGILYGDIYLEGTGDPFLRTTDLKRLVDALARKKIKKIDGHFYYDQTHFQFTDQIEEYREPWAAFNTGVSALSSEFNQFKIQLRPISGTSRYEIASQPDLPFQQFKIAQSALPKETDFLYQTDAEKETWLMNPELSGAGIRSLPIHQPALATSTLFRDLCEREGIQIAPPQEGKVPQNAKTLYAYQGRPLAELAESILEYSNNTMSELIFLAAAREIQGHGVSLEEASSVFQEWYEDRIPALKNSPFILSNGSGLTSKNRISPEHLVQILDYADRHPIGSQYSFESFLPLNRWNRLPGEVLNSPGYSYRVWAKTGAINYVHTVAGYLHTRSGRKLIFAIMSTDWKNRENLDKSNAPLSEAELLAAKDWAKKMTTLENALLIRWIDQ